MKKTTFKISKGLKGALAVAALTVMLGASYMLPKATKTAGSFALVGLVAGLKKSKKWNDLDEDTQAFAEQIDNQAKDLQDQLDDVKSAKEDLQKAIDEAKEARDGDIEKMNELQETAKNLATQLDAIQKQAAASVEASPILKAISENKEKIKDFLNKKSGKLEIEVKATQTPADIQTHTIGMRAPGIGQLPVRVPVVEPLFPVVNTNMEYIKYLDQETVVRDAKNVAGNGVTTHNTKLEWKERSIQITKVRDFIDVSIDMMEDYDFVEGEIRRLLDTSVSLKVDSGLLLGDGVHPNMHSIDEVASEFDATNTLGSTIEAWNGTLKDPNMFDLTIAMASQIVALGQGSSYMPNAVLWNTIDKYKNMLVKDASGQYLLPPFVVKVGNTEYTIDNMRVQASPLVPANSCYVFDSTKATLYNRRGIVVEMSYENATNFQTETVTVKAYRRMNLLIRNVDANAFMKCSDVTAALNALTKA